MAVMKVSIIICFYERLEYLKKCLDSLRFCSKDFDEVVIADDGSSEVIVNRLRKLIANYDFSIIHAWHARQGSRRAACRNNGIRNASGEYLIFIDGDFLVLPGSIRSHVEASKPGIFLAGRCKYLSGELTHKLFNSHISDTMIENFYLQVPERPILKEHRDFIKYGILRKLGLASCRKQTFGGHFSAYKKDIESINGYDENFVGWGGEDQDFALRMVKAGFTGRSVIRTARALHLWHPRELGDKHWKKGPNIEYFNRKKVPIFCENGLRKNSNDD
jgi:glycosyltransferase involved in cell wall biosynthesis